MATINEFSNILKNKIQFKNSAHLYIVTYHDQTQSFDDIFNIFKSTIIDQKNNDHPDLLMITRDLKEEEKEYRLNSETFKKYFEFIKYRPYSLPKKIALINDAHLISDVIFNKLLKIFEESPEYLITILCMPHQYTLLPTIESRAITVRLNSKESISSAHKPETYSSLSTLNTLIKKSPNEELKFMENQINEVLNSTHNQFINSDELLKTLKNYEIHKRFNGSINSRLTTLLR